MLALFSGDCALVTGVARGRTGRREAEDRGGEEPAYTNILISFFWTEDVSLTPSGAVENNLASPADVFAEIRLIKQRLLRKLCRGNVPHLVKISQHFSRFWLNTPFL